MGETVNIFFFHSSFSLPLLSTRIIANVQLPGGIKWHWSMGYQVNTTIIDYFFSIYLRVLFILCAHEFILRVALLDSLWRRVHVETSAESLQEREWSIPAYVLISSTALHNIFLCARRIITIIIIIIVMITATKIIIIILRCGSACAHQSERKLAL